MAVWSMLMVLVILANGVVIWPTGMVSFKIRRVTSTKVIGMTIHCRGMVLKLGLVTVADLKESLLQIIKKAKVALNGKMEATTKVALSKVCSMDMESTFSLNRKKLTMATLKWDKWKDKVKKFGWMVVNTKDNSLKE